MDPINSASVLFLIGTVIGTIALPYAVGGSLYSGLLRRFQHEENIVRSLVVIAVGSLNAISIMNIVEITDIAGIAIIVTMSTLCSIASWKMFLVGLNRGLIVVEENRRSPPLWFNLAAADLKTGLEEITSKCIANVNQLKDTISENTTRLENVTSKTTSESSDKIEDVGLRVDDLYDNGLPRQIHDLESRLCDYVNAKIGDLSEQLGKILSLMLDLNQLVSEIQKQNKDRSGLILDLKPELEKPIIPIQPIETYHVLETKLGKISEWIDMDLTEYRPKMHKLCIAIYRLLKSTKSESNEPYRPILSDIAGLTGINKADVKTRLQRLVNLSLLNMEKGQNKISFWFTDKTNRLFNPVLETQRDGGMESFYLLNVSKEHHLEKEHFFSIVRQTVNSERPDAMAVPSLDNDSFAFKEAIAIEIESPDAARAHPDQVRANMTKNLQWVSNVEVWCFSDDLDIVKKIHATLDSEQQSKVKIMPVQTSG